MDVAPRLAREDIGCSGTFRSEQPVLPRPTIEAFDAWLAARCLRLDAIVVGGAALALLGVTDRQTRDFDILHPELPEEVAQAAGSSPLTSEAKASNSRTTGSTTVRCSFRTSFPTDGN
jgi:hypothetical protein